MEGHDAATKDMSAEGDDPTNREVRDGRVPALSKRLCGEYARCRDQREQQPPVRGCSAWQLRGHPHAALSSWPAFTDVIFPEAPIPKASAAPASATSPAVRGREAVPMPARRPGPTWTNLEVAAHREGAARLRARLQAVAVAART